MGHPLDKALLPPPIGTQVSLGARLFFLTFTTNLQFYQWFSDLKCNGVHILHELTSAFLSLRLTLELPPFGCISPFLQLTTSNPLNGGSAKTPFETMLIFAIWNLPVYFLTGAVLE